MERLVIFGAGQIADVAHFYFSNDSAFKVVGFSVDAPYLREPSFHHLPVVASDELVKAFPPADHRIFIAMSYARLNQVRTEKLAAAESLGYRAASYLSTKATVWPGLEYGRNCFILEDNTIQPFARIGNNVTLWSGNHIGHHAVIGDNVFIASHVVISGSVKVGNSTFIGVNATIRDNVTIGQSCVIGAGSLILQDAKDFEVYMGDASTPSKVPSNRLRGI
jgi:sugar O-acyltransferase (sialic acid O-acetyltransferase NeuD family)